MSCMYIDLRINRYVSVNSICAVVNPLVLLSDVDSLNEDKVAPGFLDQGTFKTLQNDSSHTPPRREYLATQSVKTGTIQGD